MHGFGAEVIAGAAMFDAERNEGAAEGVAGGVIAGAEAEKAGEQVTVAFRSHGSKQLEETPPSFAALERTVPWVFVRWTSPPSQHWMRNAAR